jgi:cytochrome bd-type quinol oxidase subunit 2
MNRMLRFVFGPLLFLFYYLHVRSCYAHFAHHAGLLGQAFQVVGTAWVVAAHIAAVFLIWRVFASGGEKKLNFKRVFWSWVTLLVATYGTAWLWLYMSGKANGSLVSFLTTIVLFFVALFTLCMVPVGMSFLIRAMIIVDKPKK